MFNKFLVSKNGQVCDSETSNTTVPSMSYKALSVDYTYQ